MNPNDIFNMAASIGRAQVAAAQAAHDARQPEVDRLKNEVARLRRRLENDRVWRERDGELVEEPADLPESQDGIACRDETIKLQDEHIDRLTALNAELLAALKAAERAIDDCLNFRSHLNYAARDMVRAAIANAERAK